MAGKKQTTLASFFGDKAVSSAKTEAGATSETVEKKAISKSKTIAETVPVEEAQAYENSIAEESPPPAEQETLVEIATHGLVATEKENISSAMDDSNGLLAVRGDQPRSSLKKRVSSNTTLSAAKRPTKRMKMMIVESDSDTDVDSTVSKPESGAADLVETAGDARKEKPQQSRSKEESPVSSEEAEKEEHDDEDSDADEMAEVTAKIVSKEASSRESTGATWKKGEPVPYAALCKTFEKIESTTKRLEISSLLTAFFKNVIDLSPKDLVACIYLCLNRIGPEYEGKELGIGESILIKAVASATGRAADRIKADVAQLGDLGTVAQASKGTQKTFFPPPPLTVLSVFKVLQEIASISGQSSQTLKMGKINKLLVACRDNEPKYLIRSLEGKLRIGLAEQSILQSLAHAVVLKDPAVLRWSPEKRATTLANAAATLKHVYNELPNYDEIVPVLLEKGVKELSHHCKLRPGVPLKPMLAHPTKSLTEVLNRFENMTFTCEYKYDGERAQIHMLEDGRVMIYSRNSENLSGKYPDIIEALPKVPKAGVKSFVLDCEAVAWDREKRCILPFQVLSTRKRKDVHTADIQVQVCVFAFDLLFLNDKALTTKPLKQRREVLYQHFQEVPGIFTFAKHMESSNVDEIQTFLDEAVQGNCEGLMVKTLEQEASYEPSKRSRNWLKVKKDYLSGVGDTFDLVVIGGYIGRGKRTGWYGGYLLACYDEDREEFQSICKIGTGFSEEQLADHAKFFKEHIIDGPKSYYNWSDSPNVRPDVWFDAVQVWEVKAADLSISPVHKAALGHVDPSKGISLRFPRFIRIRDDKGPDQATTATQVADFYRSQKINSTNGDFMDD